MAKIVGDVVYRKEAKSLGYEYVDEEFSFDKLLEIFDDEDNIINILIKEIKKEREECGKHKKAVYHLLSISKCPPDKDTHTYSLKTVDMSECDKISCVDCRKEWAYKEDA